MSNIEKYYIPKRLDDPEKFILWTKDETCMFMVPTFFGIALGQGLLGFVVGGVLYYYWRRFKGKNQHNFVISTLYWHLPGFLFKLKATPPSNIKTFIG